MRNRAAELRFNDLRSRGPVARAFGYQAFPFGPREMMISGTVERIKNHTRNCVAQARFIGHHGTACQWRKPVPARDQVILALVGIPKTEGEAAS